MNKYDVLQKVQREKLIAIVRIRTQEQALSAVGALIDGGINCIELPLTAPYAHSVLECVAKQYSDRITLGAGSVLDGESARIAILSGAKFLVTPTVSEHTIRVANRYGIPVFPGIATATEALLALEYGADVVKFFPARGQSPRLIKDLRAPMPELEIIPVGGIGEDNLADWLRAGAFACGIGGALLAGAEKGDYAAITAMARKLKKIVQETCYE